ncbi:hypothetical protein AAG570_011779 [Ranatra chinensis]|uniref:Uncharacterized protein n=1 Tax=Ranatra chinensis TaxID=642074 RepID=A0ABD0YGX0_9HEMI
MRQELHDFEQPGQAQASAQVAGRQEGEAMSSLRQAVRLDTRLLHARQDPQPGLQVSPLRQMLLQAMAPPRPHQDAHRRETFQVYNLQQGFRRQVKLASPRSDPFEQEASRVSQVRQSVRAQVLSVQTRRVVLHQVSLRFVVADPFKRRRRQFPFHDATLRLQFQQRDDGFDDSRLARFKLSANVHGTVQ